MSPRRSSFDLNDEQRAAVEALDGPLLLLAGAGTGKTRVVTCRIAHIVASGHARAGEILAMTFTNKAAREMRERAEALEPSIAGRAMLSTFHSACARWLRGVGREVGLQPSFTIYDESDQKALLKTVVEKLGLPDDASSLRLYTAAIEAAHNEALTPTQLQSRSRGAVEERAADVFAEYHQALREANATDFGDLVASMVHALEQNDTLRAAFHTRFRHVMVDEFQDTNVAQYRLLRLLAPPGSSVMVVGDDDQSIYRWRGATVENVRRFSDDYGARVLALEQNYRSTRAILEAAHAVVDQLPNRFDKRLRTDRRDSEPVRVMIAPDDRIEADFVASTLAAERRQRALDWSDCAVFYRTNAQSRLFEEQLRARSIPYQVVGGLSFFERREVKDVLAWVRVAINPADEVAFRRVVGTPPRGIGAGTLRELELAQRQRGLPHLRAALAEFAVQPPPRTTKNTRQGLRSLHDQLASIELLGTSAGAAELIEAVLEHSGYEAWLRESEPDEADDRMRNIGELLSSARAFVPPDPSVGTLAPFLEHVALREREAAEKTGGGVSLMTVHSAKGLEFRLVFATGLEDAMFPLIRRGVPLDDDEAAEERRLWYVAVTRARDVLVVTASQRRALYGTPTVQRPSPFLLELARQPVQFGDRSQRLEAWSGDARAGSLRERARWDEYDQRDPSDARSRAQGSYASEVPRDGVVFDDTWYPVQSVAAAKGYVGRRAKHATFGMGVVTAADPTGDKVRLTIFFESVGEKKVVARYVELLD